MNTIFVTIEEALHRFSQGEPLIVVDDEDRENEGDIILPAIHATPDRINFCITKARGLVCLALDQQTADRLQLKKVRSNNKDPFHTAFLDSIDAVKEHGITTGISAFERSITAKLVADQNSSPGDFITPGHLFPLLAKEGGVLVRKGHTEAAVDLCQLTGLPKAAVICEILNEDGTMMRRDDLSAFSRQHGLAMITIADLAKYREDVSEALEMVSQSTIPTRHGDFAVKVYRNTKTGLEHLLMFRESNAAEVMPLVRIHSECLTGDVLGSFRCDCGEQLQNALERISQRGSGYLLYMRGHEGRGIGLGNKIAAYHLQDKGFDTFEANQQLGLPADARTYQDAVAILKQEKLKSFELLTNNPEKIQVIRDAGFNCKPVHFPSTINDHNAKYLHDKVSIAQHKLILTT